MTYDDLWSELESAPGDLGFIQRRIEPDSQQDIFLGVRKATHQRVLLLEVGATPVQLPVVDCGGALHLAQVQLRTPDRFAIELALTSSAYADLFTALVTDIVSVVTVAEDTVTAVEQLVGRFERWQSFLKVAGEGLSRQRQRGLTGELIALRDWLVDGAGLARAVAAWTGPANAPQDFSFEGIAVEVKTTAANRHQHLSISSERQLDATHLDRLFLLHVSVDEQEGVGLTLPNIVGDVRSLLKAEPRSQVIFEEKLFAGGYHDAHADRYTTGYAIREANVFEVKDGFPAVTEAQLPAGIGDVRYSVAVAACSQWVADRSELAIALGGL